MNQEKYWKVFFDIYDDLPRGGPGNESSLRKALDLMPELPPEPEVLDVGCGPGMQTKALARIIGGRITAVDNHPYYLDRLRKECAQEGLADRVTVKAGDMANLEFPPERFDLLWSEAAIYNMGFSRGLQAWKQFLKPGGYLVVSEAVWLKDNPPPDVRTFWEEYPAMTTIQANLETIRACGYTVLGHFTLSEAAWWDHFYTPMVERLDVLRARYQGDAEAMEVIEQSQRETEIYKKYSDYFGYEFFICRK